MTVAEQIGDNLRLARRRANLSQEDLARRAGLHHTEISLLECGRQLPGLDTCMKIVEATEADPRVLFAGVTWHRPQNWNEKGWFTIVGLDEPADLRRPKGSRSS
jgi:transcriptional regulator with XRE-family HTH domain